MAESWRYLQQPDTSTSLHPGRHRTGIAFILVQPMFGMAMLTSHHAAAYMSLGGYGETAALVVSWFVYLGVSIAYALLSAASFSFNRSWLANSGQILAQGWLMTLIATPANEWVVELVNSGEFAALGSLSALNTQVGPKLWLHILFFLFVFVFVFVVGRLWLAGPKRFSSTPRPCRSGVDNAGAGLYVVPIRCRVWCPWHRVSDPPGRR